MIYREQLEEAARSFNEQDVDAALSSVGVDVGSCGAHAMKLDAMTRGQLVRPLASGYMLGLYVGLTLAREDS